MQEKGRLQVARAKSLSMGAVIVQLRRKGCDQQYLQGCILHGCSESAWARWLVQ